MKILQICGRKLKYEALRAISFYVKSVKIYKTLRPNTLQDLSKVDGAISELARPISASGICIHPKIICNIKQSENIPRR